MKKLSPRALMILTTLAALLAAGGAHRSAW